MTSNRKHPSAIFWITVALVTVLVLPGCGANVAREATDARKEAERMERAARKAVETASDPEKRREAIDRIKDSKIGK